MTVPQVRIAVAAPPRFDPAELDPLRPALEGSTVTIVHPQPQRVPHGHWVQHRCDLTTIVDATCS